MSKPNWVTVSPASGSGTDTVSVSASQNTGRSQRTGTLTVSGTGVTQPSTVSITQEGLGESLSYSQPSFSVNQSGGNVVVGGTSNASSQTFTRVGNAVDDEGNTIDPETGIAYENIDPPDSYTANGASVNNGAPVTGDPGSSAAYSFYVSFTIPENVTTKNITRTYLVEGEQGAQAQVTIVQAGSAPYLTVSPNTLNISAAGEAVSLSISSNTNWTVS